MLLNEFFNSPEGDSHAKSTPTSSTTEAKRMSKKDPCWKDHNMVGTKTKGGKTVPNCVPVEEGIYDNDKTPATKVPPTSKYEAQFEEPYRGAKFRAPTSFREGDKVFRVDQPDVPGEIIALYNGDPVAKVAYQPKGQAFYILPTHLSWLGKTELEEHIVKVKGGYRLVSKKTGKNLGTYPTRAGAEKREREVQYFKHANEDMSVSNLIATEDTHVPDVITATQLINAATADPTNKNKALEYSNFINSLRERHKDNPQYSIDVHQEASKLAQKR